jgi:hypothetical protein
MKKELSRLPHGDCYDSGGQKTTQKLIRCVENIWVQSRVWSHDVLLWQALPGGAIAPTTTVSR